MRASWGSTGSTLGWWTVRFREVPYHACQPLFTDVGLPGRFTETQRWQTGHSISWRDGPPVVVLDLTGTAHSSCSVQLGQRIGIIANDIRSLPSERAPSALSMSRGTRPDAAVAVSGLALKPLVFPSESA